MVHPQEGVYVPELIFGHLLTSSNFDDEQKRFVGGRHGFGAKMTNILSTRFEVEIQDGVRGKRFQQRYERNMAQAGPATVSDIPAAEKQRLATKGVLPSYTRITFKPDLRLVSQSANPLRTYFLLRVAPASLCPRPLAFDRYTPLPNPHSHHSFTTQGLTSTRIHWALCSDACSTLPRF